MEGGHGIFFWIRSFRLVRDYHYSYFALYSIPLSPHPFLQAESQMSGALRVFHDQLDIRASFGGGDVFGFVVYLHRGAVEERAVACCWVVLARMVSLSRGKGSP